MFTVLIEWGWCKPGYSPGLISELRLGVCRVAWTHGSLIDRIKDLERALKDARDALRDLLRRDKP